MESGEEDKMIIEARLVKQKREDTGRSEWALVSKKSGRVLKWFGTKKPSEEAVQKEEKRIQYFQHKTSSEHRDMADALSYFGKIHDDVRLAISRKDKIKQEGTREVYRGPNGILFRILNYEAACLYGAQTKWCVSSRKTSENFDDVSGYSNLYFIISTDGKKYAVVIPRIVSGSEIAKEDVEKVSGYIQDLIDRINTADVYYETLPERDPEAFESRYLVPVMLPWGGDREGMEAEDYAIECYDKAVADEEDEELYCAFYDMPYDIIDEWRVEAERALKRGDWVDAFLESREAMEIGNHFEAIEASEQMRDIETDIAELDSLAVEYAEAIRAYFSSAIEVWNAEDKLVPLDALSESVLTLVKLVEEDVLYGD